MITVDKGKHVKCFLRSGMVLEGIVEESTGAQVVLRSLNDESLMIIHRPGEDIVLTKVMPTPEATETVEIESEPETPEVKVQIKTKLHEALETTDPELQSMSLEELRQLVVEQERAIIAQKKKEHFGSPGNAKLTQYSNPSTPRVNTRSPYQPGKIPSWAYGRPPRKGE